MEKKHWIQGDETCESPLFRREFYLASFPKKAVIEISGLGYFLLYVNGKRVGDMECAPALTQYHSVLGCTTTYPVWEERKHYRTYYLEFDLKPFLKKGLNVLGVWLGNGWYHQTRRVAEGKFVFGRPKLCYELTVTEESGETIVLKSDSQTVWKPSRIRENNLFYGEVHDLSYDQEDWLGEEAPGREWSPARTVHAPETELVRQDCPFDRVIRTIEPRKLFCDGERRIYDCGENLTGWVTVSCAAKAGETVRVRHSEELSGDGTALSYTSAGGEGQIQEDRYLCSGKEEKAHPNFCWHGFRYFEITGPGKPVSVSVIHTDVSVASTFRCSDPVLNWLYDAYIRTQLANIHGCIPSDCPHRERLGYTGDGQLTAETAMLTLHVKGVYDKWMQDILDSQGEASGHIPHTAPFLGGGGGPGGWGGAVFVVPMAYYRVYGDKSLLKKAYPAILDWLSYMAGHCENGLVVREEEGGWCLGDWCVPKGEEMVPEPFVNTYYYIKGLENAGEAARILGEPALDWLAGEIERSKKAMQDAYFDEETGSFAGGADAADAFALDLGIGTEKTREALRRRYREKGCLDTGIFGTPILLEQLFSIGEADLAVKLLTGRKGASYARMMESGATTLWENWDGEESHNHPMFGSVVKFLFTEILGIRRREGESGLQNCEIRPAAISGLAWARGSIAAENGILEVSWEKEENGKLRLESRWSEGG